MTYKYITANNLIERQNYMYTEYGGKEFIEQYIETRKSYINDKEFIEDKKEYHISERELAELLRALRSGHWEEKQKKLTDAYLKSFEVRKRLYTEYDCFWKPAEFSSYEHYELYLMLAEILPLAYRLTGCAKYFSCMLKIDDTLLSVCEKLTVRQQSCLAKVLEEELCLFAKLASDNGISVGEDI